MHAHNGEGLKGNTAAEEKAAKKTAPISSAHWREPFNLVPLLARHLHLAAAQWLESLPQVHSKAAEETAGA